MRPRSSLSAVLGVVITLSWPGWASAQTPNVGFGPGVSSPSANSVDSMVGGDFNNDGRNDLVALGAFEDAIVIAILPGRGDGSFAAFRTVLAGNGSPLFHSPLYGEAVDFNRDGFLDLMVGHRNPSILQIYLGRGDYTFHLQTALPAAAGESGAPGPAIVGDLNADAIPDVFYVRPQTVSSPTGDIYTFLGNGDGTFRAAIARVAARPPTRSTSTPLGIADVNGDEHADVVVHTASATGEEIRVLFGNGTGAFDLDHERASVTGGGARQYLSDLNRDGLPDVLAYLRGTTTVRLFLKLGRADGSFGSADLIELEVGEGETGGPSIELDDFDLDGELDVLVPAHVASSGAGAIYLFSGLGEGRFSREPDGVIVAEATPTPPRSVDLNGDRRPDVATHPVPGLGGTSLVTTFLGLSGGGGGGSIWSAHVNVIVGERSLVKSGGCDGCADAGAVTTAVVASGDAVAQFVFPQSGALLEAGLAHAFSLTGIASIDFGIRFQGEFAEVREAGEYRADILAEPGATFRIAVTSGTVTYAMNGTVFYTSSVTPTYPFVLGVHLFSAGASIESVTFGGGSGGGGGSGIWTAPINAVTGQNSLLKSGGCDGCPDAGAMTTAVVASGNAVAQFVFPETFGLRLVGLASAFSVANVSSIDFGIRVQSGYVEVREAGVYRADIQAEPGSSFRIAVASGVVTYAKNGTIFYTSSLAPTYPFALGVQLLNAGTSVSSVTFSGATPSVPEDLPAEPVPLGSGLSPR